MPDMLRVSRGHATRVLCRLSCKQSIPDSRSCFTIHVYQRERWPRKQYQRSLCPIFSRSRHHAFVWVVRVVVTQTAATKTNLVKRISYLPGNSDGTRYSCPTGVLWTPSKSQPSSPTGLPSPLTFYTRKHTSPKQQLLLTQTKTTTKGYRLGCEKVT